jgi:hypothetical protein
VFSACSTDPATIGSFDATCPVVSAAGWAGVLAEISSVYSRLHMGVLPQGAEGGLLEIDAWDPGEGALRLEVLDPLTRSVSFDWEVADRSGSDAAPVGGWSGSIQQPGGTPCAVAPPGCAELDLLGADPLETQRGWNVQPGPYRGSRSKYSDRMLTLTTGLPPVLDEAYGPARAISVRYTTGQTPTDRTTWQAGVWEVGDAPTAP